METIVYKKADECPKCGFATDDFELFFEGDEVVEDYMCFKCDTQWDNRYTYKRTIIYDNTA